jgi:hypothetical protein
MPSQDDATDARRDYKLGFRFIVAGWLGAMIQLSPDLGVLAWPLAVANWAALSIGLWILVRLPAN